MEGTSNWFKRLILKGFKKSQYFLIIKEVISMDKFEKGLNFI